MPEEKKVRLNEQVLTEDEFQKKKVELEKKPGVKVIKIEEGVYKTRLKG